MAVWRYAVVQQFWVPIAADYKWLMKRYKSRSGAYRAYERIKAAGINNVRLMTATADGLTWVTIADNRRDLAQTAP